MDGESEDVGGAVFETVEDLEGFLGECGDVSRGQRRALVSGARRLRGFLACEGVPAERVRFRVLRCSCCGQVELSGFDCGPPRSQFH